MTARSATFGPEDAAALGWVDHEPIGVGTSGPRPGSHALRFMTPAELRAETPEKPDWIWGGYVAAGNLVLLVGKPKAGKSTLAFALTEAITTGADAFLGRSVRRSPVVYVSEEGASTLLPKLAPDHAPVHILTRENAWPKPDWPQLVKAAVERCRAVNARLLVIDTAAYWTALPAEREKDAGAVQAVMQPLVAAARANVAVLLVHHARKGGGEDGDAVRGSSGWAATADTILELERPPGEGARPGQRLLIALSRYPDTPSVLLVDRDAHTGSWAATGTAESRSGAQGAAVREHLLSVLPLSVPGMARAEIDAETGMPPQRWNSAMKDLLASGAVVRDGAGVRGNPFLYRRALVPEPAIVEPVVEPDDDPDVVRLEGIRDQFLQDATPAPTCACPRPGAVDVDEDGVPRCLKCTKRRIDGSAVAA